MPVSSRAPTRGITTDPRGVIIGEDAADPERGCDPAQCVAASQHGGLAVEEVAFDSTRDARYYAVVDGYDGAVSGYTLEIV